MSLISNQLEAWEISREVHKNQKRKSGEPYIKHIESTVNILMVMESYNENTILMAILHDVLEDCNPDKYQYYHTLIKEKFGGQVISGLEYLTHKEGQSYQDYIDDMIKTCPYVIPIKIADMISNLTDCPNNHQKEKYLEAFPKLLKNTSFLDSMDKIPYNHMTMDIPEATGLSRERVQDIGSLSFQFLKESKTISELMEKLEKSLNKRELAYLGSRFVTMCGII